MSAVEKKRYQVSNKTNISQSGDDGESTKRTSRHNVIHFKMVNDSA